MARSLRAFWPGLDAFDVCWLLGPNPLALLFAALAVLRGRRLVLGVRQDLVAYTRSRYPGRRLPVAAAGILDAAYRAIGRVGPTPALVGASSCSRPPGTATCLTGPDRWPVGAIRVSPIGVNLASVIVVQTEDQLAHARDAVNRPLQLIRSFAEPVPAGDVERQAFLWIGRLVDYKDPVAYVDLAQRLPASRFWMVADIQADAPPDLINRIRDSAAELPNLELLPQQPRAALLAR